MVAIEALYIYDEHNNVILDHYYTGRPLPAKDIIQLYLKEPAPRPALIYLPNTSPRTLLFSHLQDRLLFLCPVSSEKEPLVVVELLHRIADALEDFLGAPLLPSKIEANYDTVLQIASEICDAGIIHNTEPNAVREVVEIDDWVGNILGGIGLPSSTPALSRSQSPALGSIGHPSSSTATSATGSILPWRRSNVKHTSNELYVDIVETLSVVLAPSGRPVSAFANGTIAFNAKISGVPDLLLALSAPGGKRGIVRAMDLPVFHPCVRLARWRDQPGDLSFVPPDGRFALAGYECDLSPSIFDGEAQAGKIPTPNVSLPVSAEMTPSLGTNGDELEVRLLLPLRVAAGASASVSYGGPNAARSLNNAGRPTPSTGSTTPVAGGPSPENIVVAVPLPSSVRNVTDIKSSKGEAHFLPAEAQLQWRISGREATTIGSAGATMRCTLIGAVEDKGNSDAAMHTMKLRTETFDYDEGLNDAYQDGQGDAEGAAANAQATEPESAKLKNLSLMPKLATLSFYVKGWLASGIKVEGLSINTKASTGLGAGVSPYKGVKYHTISEQGVEIRC